MQTQQPDHPLRTSSDIPRGHLVLGKRQFIYPEYPEFTAIDSAVLELRDKYPEDLDLVTMNTPLIDYIHKRGGQMHLSKAMLRAFFGFKWMDAESFDGDKFKQLYDDVEKISEKYSTDSFRIQINRIRTRGFFEYKTAICIPSIVLYMGRGLEEKLGLRV